MSLLGRLEDLSLPDIVQIVYLSRRTGMLEIIDGDSRWGIFFVNGLIANAFSPHDESLLDFLRSSNALSSEDLGQLEKQVEDGAVPGEAIVDGDLMSASELAELVRVRITTIVRPLLARKSGEFNFILSDAIGPREIGYDIEFLFKQGGILPAEILEEGEKAKPLQNLEETMRAGKALLRGEQASEVAAFGFGEEIEQMTARPEREAESEVDEDTEPPDLDEEEEDATEPEAEVEERSREAPASSETEFAELELETPLASAEPADPAEEPDPFGAMEATGQPGSLAGMMSDEAHEEWEVPTGETEPPAAKSEGGPLWSVENLDQEEEEPPIAASAGTTPHSPPYEEGERASDPPPVSSSSEEKVGSRTAPPQARSLSTFRIEKGKEIGIEDRNVVLFERNPMLRVAAKRAFDQNSFNIFQFGRIDEVRKTVNEMLDANRFFVSFLELVPEEEQLTTVLLHQIKRTNRHLPVVVIDAEANLERRHGLLKLGCDMYLTKPSPAHLQPAIADQSLALFSDELVQFTEHAVQNWERLTQTFGEGEKVGATLYEIAEKERLNRTRTLMRSLINELADPDDINQVSQTILRLADEYLDRAALFAASPTRFIGLGGFGPAGKTGEMNQLVRRIRIARDAESVLGDVVSSGKTHKGKLRKTAANVKLLQGLGPIQPTQVIVIPIENDGVPVGVLYGDNAGQGAAIGKTSGLEIFLEQAGLALHNAIVTSARRKGLDWETK